LTSAVDSRGVLTLTYDLNRTGQLVASIVVISEQTRKLVLEAAMETARADAVGNVTVVIDQVCRLAVAAGVATGEIAWLVGELESSETDDDQLAEARAAVTGLQSSMLATAYALQEVADSDGPVEVACSAATVRRAGLQLEDLLEAPVSSDAVTVRGI
jgi:methyl-accepting chemotaxis protein